MANGQTDTSAPSGGGGGADGQQQQQMQQQQGDSSQQQQDQPPISGPRPASGGRQQRVCVTGTREKHSYCFTSRSQRSVVLLAYLLLCRTLFVLLLLFLTFNNHKKTNAPSSEPSPRRVGGNETSAAENTGREENP